VALDAGVGLLEPPLHGFRQLVPQLRELRQRLLQIFALTGQVFQPRLLACVLLRRERIHLAERLAPALEAGDLCSELLDLLVRERLGGPTFGEASERLVAFLLEAGGLDAHGGDAFRSLARRST
jgi:hypothetical protein